MLTCNEQLKPNVVLHQCATLTLLYTHIYIIQLDDHEKTCSSNTANIDSEDDFEEEEPTKKRAKTATQDGTVCAIPWEFMVGHLVDG